MKSIILLSAVLLILSGCGTKEVRPVDRVKSCEALLHEQKDLRVSLQEVPEKSTHWVHLGVISAGVIASLNPYNLLSKYYYVLPALTITYYNLFAADNQLADHEASKRQRLEMLDALIRDKNCTTKGKH